jgi:glycosyltransferase involved in cell wall biosynthesis
MPPLVSILIPAHNAASYLAETLRSALGQTWPHKEVIVVEDGSRDTTLEVARSFEPAGVRVIGQENSGAAAARNRAFRESHGVYIQYLDADDLLAPDKIENQLRRLEAEPPGCVAAGRWGRFRHEVAEARFAPEPFWADLPPVDWLVACWERLSMMHPGAWLVRRATVEQAGTWDESLTLNDDGEFFCRVVLTATRVCFCPGASSYYRSDLPGSLSGSRSPAAWDSALRSLRQNRARLLAREDSPRTRRALALQFQCLVYDAYPDNVDVVRQAQAEVASLGGCDLPCPGGPVFRAAARLFGWRGGRRLQRLGSRLPLWRAVRRLVASRTPAAGQGRPNA